MKKFLESIKDYSIRWKLSFMVGVSTFLMSVLGVAALWGARELNQQTEILHDKWMNANTVIADLDFYTSQVRLKQYSHLVTSTLKGKEEVEQEIERLKETVQGLLAEYDADIETETDRQYYDAARDRWETYLQVTGDRFLALSRAMKVEEANALMLGEGFQSYSDFQEHFDLLLEFNHQGAEDANDYAKKVFAVISIIVIVLVV